MIAIHAASHRIDSKATTNPDAAAPDRLRSRKTLWAGRVMSGAATLFLLVDATVKVLWTPGDYQTKLNTGLLGSNGPDVFESSINRDMVKSKQVVPLDDVIASVKSDYSDADLKSQTVDGKIYAIKMIDDIGLLYYRKSMLQKAGVQPPTTFDELIDATAKLTNKNVKGLFLGNDGGVNANFGGGAVLGLLLWSAGLDFLTADNKPGFDDPRAVLAFTKMRKLYSSKNLLLGAPQDWWDPSAFTTGLCAMQWTGLWAMPGIKKALGDDFGVVAWPKVDAQGKPCTFLGGWAAMVSAKAKDQDAAKAFVKWLWVDNTKDIVDWNLSYGFHIPPRKTMAANATKLQSGQAADALKIAQQDAVPGNPAWTPAMNTAYSDMLTNIVRKGANPAPEIAKAKTAVNKELKRLFG